MSTNIKDTTFSAGKPEIVTHTNGLPAIAIKYAGKYLVVATFEERTTQGDDGHEEAWANAHFVLEALQRAMAPTA